MKPRHVVLIFVAVSALYFMQHPGRIDVLLAMFFGMIGRTVKGIANGLNQTFAMAADPVMTLVVNVLSLLLVVLLLRFVWRKITR